MSRPSRTEALSLVTNNIGDSVIHAKALKDALEIERKALETQDVDALSAIVHRKTACAEKLKVLDQNRGALLQEWGFSDGADPMHDLIQWCDDNDVIGDRWAELMAVAAEGNNLNLTNGAIIRVRQQHFESSLSVLRGVTPGSDTYGRNGEESGDFSRRSLAEA
ncbi:MAG: flagellar protein FlgN [Gammaproteobacteria bacterium]|nr:flagellar protein FlgN [Gammaproteobacteria bacterium]